MEGAIEVHTRPWKLVFSAPGLQRQEFTARDLFDALVALRRELEKLGIKLLCAGARTDVFPSGMSRSMGGGRKAYVMRMGTPASELVDIFDYAGPELVGGVDQQREFRDQWLVSLKKIK